MHRWAVLVLGSLLVGCAPSPLFRLSSLDPSARWLSGQQWSRLEDDSTSVVVTYDRTRGDVMLFQVEIVNRSSVMRMVEPTAVYYTIEREDGSLPARWSGPVHAVDPERVLDGIDRYEAVAVRNQQTSARLESVSSALDLVSDIATAGSRTEAEQKADERADLERAANRYREAEQQEREMRSFDEARTYWTERALRRTELAPGQSIAGQVALPTRPLGALTKPRSYSAITRPAEADQPATETITLHLPVGSRTRELRFVARRL